MTDLLWLGDPGCRDAPEPFCPCDMGSPNDCQPEDWAGAHAPRPPCERCGLQLYVHQGNYCRRPTPWAHKVDDDWIWYALRNDVPWKKKAVDLVRAALARYAAVPRSGASS